LHRAVQAAGADYHLWSSGDEGPDDEMLTGRLVASWNTTEAEVDSFLAAMRAG
jgi:threonine aldolase